MIGKIRSERSEPVTLSWDKDEELVQQVKSASPTEDIDSYPHEKLAPDVVAIGSHSQADVETMREITQTESAMGMFLICQHYDDFIKMIFLLAFHQ